MMKYWKSKPYSPINGFSLPYVSFDKRPAHLAAIFFLAAFLFASCEKPEQSVGIDLQPSDDLISVATIDTFTVIGFTLPEDSIRTESVTPALIGAYIDPVFGLSKASHFTELRLTTANPVFGTPGQSESVIVDSLILNLSFFSLGAPLPVYGGWSEQYFQVFEIDDTLAVDQAYYGNQRLNIIDEDLVEPGFNLIQPNYRDSSIVDGLPIRPSVRIPLKKELATRLIEAGNEDGLTASEFIEELNGLYITVDENAAGVNLSRTGILSIDNFSTASRMEMYYRDTFPDEPDTTFYDFEIRSAIGKYNAFDHDFSRGGETPLIRQVVDSIESAGGQNLYIQAMSGTKLRIDLPYIEALRDSGNLAIAKAELKLSVREGSIGRFTPPSGLFIFGLDEEGESFLIDDQLDGSSFVGGQYDPVNLEYRFVISRYLQQVISGERDFHGLEIVTQSASFSPNRVVLNGANATDTDKRLQLEISFTKF